MHLFVIGCLQQNPTMLGAHSKRVGSLKTGNTPGLLNLIQIYQLNGHMSFLQ